jgi:hypothetical protein
MAAQAASQPSMAFIGKGLHTVVTARGRMRRHTTLEPLYGRGLFVPRDPPPPDSVAWAETYSSARVWVVTVTPTVVTGHGTSVAAAESSLQQLLGIAILWGACYDNF